MEYEPPKVQYPICPVCGQECSTIIRDKFRDIVGCENCTEEQDAWEWMEDEKYKD